MSRAKPLFADQRYTTYKKQGGGKKSVRKYGGLSAKQRKRFNKKTRKFF